MEKKNMLLSLVLLIFSVSMESAKAITNCRIPVETLPASNPIYMSGTSPFYPNGTSGQLGLIQGQTLTITCPGSQLLSPHSSERPQTATIFCVDGNIVSSLDWLPYYNFTFTEISCACPQKVRYTLNTECRPGSNTVKVQLVADSHIYDLYSTCYSNATSMSEYAIYSINGYNYFTQTLASDPPYQQGRYSNYVIVDELYSPASQEYSLGHYLGRQMVPQYLRPGNYLGRGELVHRKTFVFNTEQLSAFHYVNVVPIWQSVDNGNWISLQRSIKKKISQSGTRVQVHSGHWGNLALDDEAGTPTKIYLNSFQDELPVPLYVYKVIRDPDSFKATAFVIINNPHITEIQARGLVFCPNFCAGSTIFSWLDWEDDDVFKGYAFCCEVPEFLKTVTNLPPISSSGLFA